MKIFGIGLSKTGTSSLARALEILGYRTKDYPGIERYLPGDLASIDASLLEQYDALTDTPIPSFYRELDRAYPGAKFILTVRDMPGWLQSCKKQFTERHAQAMNEAHARLFHDLYGTTVFDEAKFRAGYERFARGVLDYFAARPHDLLVLNITAGEGWERLCAFLDKPVPDIPFPKANVTRIRWMDVHALERIARQAGRRLQRLHQALQTGAPLISNDWLASLPTRLKVWVYGRERSISAAVQTVTDDVSALLRRLNPDIPIVSRLAADVDYATRKGWNHFWLIDPLDGEAGIGSAKAAFSLNIALIEDQRPVAGVIYSPATGIAYYAMISKGVYCHDGSGSPRRVESHSTETLRDQLAEQLIASRALNLCRDALLPPWRGSRHEGTAEWHSAAAQAIANFLGARAVACDSEREVIYNKPEWINPCIKIV